MWVSPTVTAEPGFAGAQLNRLSWSTKGKAAYGGNRPFLRTKREARPGDGPPACGTNGRAQAEGVAQGGTAGDSRKNPPGTVWSPPPTAPRGAVGVQSLG
jgi:hypothetical protein